MKNSKVAEQWLEASAHTANTKDHAAHMNLISKKVRVFGVPGFEVLGYDDWARQSKHEFETGLLARVSYRGLKVLALIPGKVMFKTIETLETRDGAAHSQGVEIVLEKEADGNWRVVQERVLPPEETEHDKIDE